MKGCTEELATMKQEILRRILSRWRGLGGRAHFSASLPLLVSVNNVSLTNPSLDLACARGGGEGFITWMIFQGTVETSTLWGSDSSLLAQQLDGRLASTDSLRKSAWVTPGCHPVCR